MLTGTAKPMVLARGLMAVLMPITSALEVDERAAGVARVDGGVGLDEVVVAALADDAVLGAHDARRHRVLESEGVADGHHPLAGPHALGVAQRQGEEGLRRSRP